MNKTFVPSPQQARYSSNIPWLSFLFLTVIFFVAQHDWYFSLGSGEGFVPTVDEFSIITEQGNILRRVVFLSLGIFAGVSLLRMKSYRAKVNGILGWMILLLLSWTFLSIAWSEDPAFTFRKLVLLTMLSLGAFAVNQCFSPRDMVLWVFLSAFAYLNIGIVAEIVLGTFYPLSTGYRFAGTLHPNSQGVNCALLLFASLFMLKSGTNWRKLFYLAAVESLFFLFFTKSRTSLSLALFALFFYWFVTLPLSRKGAIVLGGLFVTCLMLLLGEYIFPSLQQAISLGRQDTEAITLTGRIPIWNQVLSYIAKRPIQGYGYDTFWTSRHIAEIANEQSWTVTQAHSAYLDSFLGLGLIGGGTFLLIIIVTIRRACITFKCSKNDAYGFFGVVLIFIALNGLLESITIQPSHASFVFMLALVLFGFSGQNVVQKMKDGYGED